MASLIDARKPLAFRPLCMTRVGALLLLYITVHSVATATIGIARRKGLRKIGQLDVADLWIQDNVKGTHTQVVEVLGAENVAKLLINRLTRQISIKQLHKCI